MIRRPGSIRQPALTDSERISGTTVIAAGGAAGTQPGHSDGGGGRRGMSVKRTLVAEFVEFPRLQHGPAPHRQKRTTNAKSVQFKKNTRTRSFYA